MRRNTTKPRRVAVVIYDHSLHKIHMIETMAEAKYLVENSTYRVDSNAITSALDRRPEYRDHNRYSVSGVLIGNQDEEGKFGQITWADLVETKEAVTL